MSNQPSPALVPDEVYFRTHHLRANVGERAARGGAVAISAQALKFVITIASTSILARLLTPQDYGLIGMVTFLKDDVIYQNGVRVLRRNLEHLSQKFDFIMLHHSFEHLPDPLATLRKAYELVKPGHYLLLRIPVAGSYAWRKYGVNWVALDAPRHLFLHTLQSIQILASQAGFEVADVIYDANGFSHWGSELYLRNIPLTDERSPWVNPKQDTFSKADLARSAELDEKLNETGEADCAAFYLHKR